MITRNSPNPPAPPFRVGQTVLLDGKLPATVLELRRIGTGPEARQQVRVRIGEGRGWVPAEWLTAEAGEAGE